MILFLYLRSLSVTELWSKFSFSSTGNICTKISNSTLKLAIFLNTKHINEVRWYIQGTNLTILLSKQVGLRRLRQMYFILNGRWIVYSKINAYISFQESHILYSHTLYGTTGKIHRKINASYCTEQLYLSTLSYTRCISLKSVSKTYTQPCGIIIKSD